MRELLERNISREVYSSRSLLILYSFPDILHKPALTCKHILKQQVFPQVNTTTDMQSKLLLILGAAALAVSQNTDCDNNDTPDCSTTSNSYISYNTDTSTVVYTPVATSVVTDVDSTSLPHSLDTVTTGIVVSSTSQSVYTTNTLNEDTSSATGAAATISSGNGAAMITAGAGAAGMALLGVAALL